MQRSLNRTFGGLVSLAAFGLPALGYAQETSEAADAALATAASSNGETLASAAALSALNTEMAFIFNTFLLLFAGVLVFWMAAGFAMLETGLVRSKNATMQLTKNVGLFSVAGLLYYFVGYRLMYPGEDWLAQGWLGAIGVAVLEAVGITAENADDVTYAATGADFFFQLMFCAATASIVSGALAERIKLSSFLLFTLVLTGLIYPIQGSWKWGGGWLDAIGFIDFAGSTIVHSVGGWAALTGAILLGARTGKYGPDGKINVFPGSNLALATLGTFILWLGWFGFNGGSQLAMGTIGDAADVSRIMVNTNLAASAGAVTAMLLTMILYRKPDLTLMLNGALAGLVAITAEPLHPTIGWALVIGAIGGAIVVFSVPLLDRLKIDDVVGAIPVHLFAGIWGTLAVVITNPEASLWAQIVGIVSIGLFVVVASALAWAILKALLGLRVDAEAEVAGLDKVELGMEAYPEFTRS